MYSEIIKKDKSCKIVVGSTNEAKILAVQEAFGLVYKSITVNPIQIDDTPWQPLSDKETLLGAQQRAASARAACPEADYWVGIEGGVEEIADELMVMAWVVILNATESGRSRSASYQLPRSATAALRGGGKLGDISQKMEGTDWRSRGLVAHLSYGLITRTSLYVQPVILALLPLLNRGKTYNSGG